MHFIAAMLLVLRRLTQEDHWKFKVSLGYIESSKII